MSEMDDVTFKSVLIVGKAKETMEVSIADINIIKISATTMPNDFIFMYYSQLSYLLKIYINFYLIIIYF